MKPLVAILAVSWAGFWFTPDQQGRRLFYRGEYAEAAKAFHDPMWQGIAWFRAADFKQPPLRFPVGKPQRLFSTKATHS